MSTAPGLTDRVHRTETRLRLWAQLWLVLCVLILAVGQTVLVLSFHELLHLVKHRTVTNTDAITDHEARLKTLERTK